jgi:hypothetical protein
MAALTRKYDLAFSFRKADLPLARRLAEAVDPLVSFVYADRQDEIILQDGMDVFGRVFSEESRLNVVLFRAGYGDKGWTNFEQQIIKARCLGNEGWTSFALLQVDDAPVPAWVPPTYIYGDAHMSADVLASGLKHRAKLLAPVSQTKRPRVDSLNWLTRRPSRRRPNNLRRVRGPTLLCVRI